MLLEWTKQVSLTDLKMKLPRKHFVLDLKKGWFSTNASSDFKCPFPSAFGKVLAFLAQPSSDGEKYALLSAGTVSVNLQRVVIQRIRNVSIWQILCVLPLAKAV